jgi:hypothetical protein
VPPDAPRSISRADLEVVIRRAAELSMRDADADEQLSEQDLVRIANDLGLSTRHVWQALYERPTMTVPSIVGEKYFGSAVIAASRVLQGDVPLTRRRLEDYLVTQEYLTVARRSAEELRLVPAEDTISSVARVFARPKRRHHLAHARRVLVATRPLPGDGVAVRIEADMSERRREDRQGAIVAGTFAGLLTGVFAAVPLTTGIIGPIGDIAGAAGFLVAGGGAAFGTFVAYARAFRRKVAEATLELDALLDRLETGERLEPPAAPWRRRLGLKFFGPRA